MSWIFPGVPEGKHILQLKSDLEKMDNPQRVNLRDSIAHEIVNDISDRLVILSGPGTGKSHIFVNKIKSILKQSPYAKILVTTFVNKLAKELNDKIENDAELKSRKSQISSRTLHAIAFEILKNSTFYADHYQIIFPSFLEDIWLDIMEICGADSGVYSLISFQHQIHDLTYKQDCQADPMWEKIHELYSQILHFYKALSFDDQIKLAYEGISNGKIECPKYDFVIVDEYQDFNKCEKDLINTMISNSKYTLFAGDDDQVLYDTMKNSHKEYIRELYQNDGFKKAFLPFCGRCSSNIVNAARCFIENTRRNDLESIDKIYLPIASNDGNPKINVVACAHPSSAVDYIENFIKVHAKEITEIEKKLKQGEPADPFLFIISANCKEKYIARYRKLKELIEKNQHIVPTLISNTYKSLCDYLSLAKNPENNLAARKVMAYEKIDKPYLIVKEALDVEKNIVNVRNATIDKIFENAKLVLNIYEKYQLNDIDSLVSELCRLSFIDKIRVDHKESVELLKKEITDFKLLLDPLQKGGLNVVELMSFERCKGLTAEHVFIVGFDDNNMKYVKENAFYVAMTRARKSLHLITTLKVGGATCPHPYLRNLPTDDLNFLKHTKKDGSSELGSCQNFISTIKKWARNKKIH